MSMKKYVFIKVYALIDRRWATIVAISLVTRKFDRIWCIKIGIVLSMILKSNG